MKQNNLHPLRFNVGFLLRQSVGSSRSFAFDESSIQVSEDLDLRALRGQVRFTRTAQGLYAKGTLRAEMRLECVRCLSPLAQPLTIELDHLFVYPPEKAEDPMLAIAESALLNLAPLVREYMWLDVPIQPLCRSDCQGLCPICGKNRNETECDHPEAEIDPRMAKLQTLLSES